jgi:two-component system, NarL family, sensor kinase
MATESAPARRAHSAHRVMAGCLAGLALAEIATTVAATLAAQASFADAVGAFLVTNGAMGLTFPVCGGLLAWHRPRNPIGWLFLAAGLGMATSAAAASLVLLGGHLGWDDGALRLLGTIIDRSAYHGRASP